MIRDYDKWKTGLPEDSYRSKILYICPICDYEIHEGEGVIHIGVDDVYVCDDDCFEKWAKEALDARLKFI